MGKMPKRIIIPKFLFFAIDIAVLNKSNIPYKQTKTNNGIYDILDKAEKRISDNTKHNGAK